MRIMITESKEVRSLLSVASENGKHASLIARPICVPAVSDGSDSERICISSFPISNSSFSAFL